MGPDAWVTNERFADGEFLRWQAVAGDLRCGIRTDGTAACVDRDGAPARTGLPGGALQAWVLAWDVGCGLRADGRVACGSVARGEALPFRPPPDPLRSFDVSWLGSDLCGVRPDGTLVCALGERTRLSAPPAGTFTAVSCGDTACCALAADGAPRCWGTSETLVRPPAGPLLDVAVDGSVACGVRPDGALSCWGEPTSVPRVLPSGPFRAVDHGIVASRADGTAVVLDESWYSHVAYALPPVRWADGTFAVDPAGRPFAYRGNAFGPVPEGRFVDVDAGTDAACAVSAEGRVACFGGEGWVVNGAPAGDGFVEVSVGPWVACARRADGSTACWGRPDWMRNEDAAFAAMLAGDARAAAPTVPPLGAPVVSLLPGTGTCGVTATGAVLCRDGAAMAAVGGASVVGGRRSDLCARFADGIRCGGVRALADGGGDRVEGDAIGLAKGYEHACAWTAEGARCWGRDTSGETEPPPGPFRLLALGEKRSCGLRPDGRAECWGGHAAPPPPDRFVDLALTQETDLRMDTYTCGIRADDGALRCWSYGPVER